MGAIFSCCCGPRKRSEEREPLLPTHRYDSTPPLQDRLVPTQATFDKFAAIVAALQNGKLPTQTQLNHAIRSLLDSSMFRDAPKQGGVLSQRGRIVLEDVRRLLEAVTELGLDKNDDDSIQHAIYQLRHTGSHPATLEPHIEVGGAAPLEAAAQQLPLADIPSSAQVQRDAQALSDSVKTLVTLLFTSSAFRLLLTDIFVTAREILADLAAQIGDVALVVESGARVAEGVVRPSEEERHREDATLEEPAEARAPEVEDIRTEQAQVKVEAEKKILETVDQSTQKGKEAWQKLQQKAPDRIRETVLERIQSIIRQAQADPRFLQALQTMVDLVQRYYHVGLQTALSASSAAEAAASSIVNDTQVEAEVDVNIDPHLKEALLRLHSVLERFVGGRMDTALHDVEKLVHDVSLPDDDGQSAVVGILARARQWLGRALKDTDWVATDEATSELASIYDDAKGHFNGEAPPEQKTKHDLADLGQDLQALLDTLAQDPALRRVLDAITTLTMDTAYFASVSKPDVVGLATREGRRAYAELKREVQRDILEFVVPRLIQALKIIPLPRMELKSPTVDAVLDNLNISSLSFIPDNITVTNVSQLGIVGSDTARARGSDAGRTVVGVAVPTVTVSEAVTRTRIQVKGLRVSADDIGYYANVRGPCCLGWKDWGLLSMDVGEKGAPGEGLSIDLELELAGEELDSPTDAEPRAYFSVIDVKVDAPGLAFTIKKSRHWIFNSLLLQPLLGPSAREAISIVLAQKIRETLEGIGKKLGEASRQAALNGQNRELNWIDWALTIFTGVPPLRGPYKDDQASESDSNSDEEEVDVLDYQPTPVTSNTVTAKGVIHTSHQPATLPEEDTVIAIGIGAQVLSDVPVPSPTTTNPTLVDVQRDALDDIQGKVDDTSRRISTVEQTAEDTRTDIRRKALKAGDRYQARAEAERARSGWKSKAFDVGR
ncbi:hypothetical protein FS837_008096 [Tulasnella sp. UAMH 9824]|nr:hypothetical protein FS837_008096 [Tulasnella sp. UAMH 9824]